MLTKPRYELRPAKGGWVIFCTFAQETAEDSPLFRTKTDAKKAVELRNHDYERSLR